MKFLFPNLSELFATWASAGQYGCIAELDPTPPAQASASGKGKPVTRKAVASDQKTRRFG